MHYYVDGYNLIFRVLKAKDSLKSKRSTLITDLSNKIDLLKLHTTLVFDSQYQHTEATRHHHKNLEIYYTDEGETADDYIIKCLKANQYASKRQITVVTSDLHLAWRARRENALTMLIDEYLDWIARRHRNKISEIRKELEAPPSPSKIELPKLIPEPVKKKSEDALDVRPHDFDYYLEQFGGVVVSEEEERVQPKLNELVEPKKEKHESDFDRWLREFGG
jgi:predicted RNA-binding protein with PIN domain